MRRKFGYPDQIRYLLQHTYTYETEQYFNNVSNTFYTDSVQAPCINKSLNICSVYILQ